MKLIIFSFFIFFHYFLFSCPIYIDETGSIKKPYFYKIYNKK